MSILKSVISRRTVLKQAGIQLLALIVGTHLQHNTGKSVQAASVKRPYGSGAFDQGVYPGHQIYLPFITKEET